MIKISILGCGWLGNKFGTYLNKTSYTINGSSTSGSNSPIMEQNQIKPHTVNINETIDLSQYDEEFFNCDALIISLKPKRSENDFGYFEKQINVCTLLAKKYAIKQVILWSSTSVYGDSNRIVDEQSALIPTRPSGNSLVKAEQILLNEPSFSTTILRLGGLIGYDRNPYHVIKNSRRTGSLYIPVNLVHADDVIRVTERVINLKYAKTENATTLIKNDSISRLAKSEKCDSTKVDDHLEGEHNSQSRFIGKESEPFLQRIYNVVCDEHPLRIQYYQKAYAELGIVPNAFDPAAKNAFKIVDNKKLKTELNYEFLLKSPAQLYQYKPLLSE